MPFYYISLGSNIEPEKNIVLMLKELLDMSPTITISRIIQTKPEGIVSDNYFLNLCAFIESADTNIALKQQFNQIEEKLGRNRSDKNRSKKDRTADLDILFPVDNLDNPTIPLPIDHPDYVKLPLIDLLYFQEIEGFTDEGISESGITLQFENLTIGQEATIITYDSETNSYKS